MKQIFSMSLLIVGNLVGVGILALPISTGIAGFMPTMFGLLLTGFAMLLSAFVLSKEAIEQKVDTFNYPSLYKSYLGNLGKWVAIVANLIILYGILTAYLTAIATIVINTFHLSIPPVWVTLGYFSIITIITFLKIQTIQKYIAVLVVLKCIAFAIICVMAELKADFHHLTFSDWLLFPAGIPIMIGAFHFHNIIPNVCQSLKWGTIAIKRAIIAGMLIGLLMNTSWIIVTLGVLPMDNSTVGIIHAFKENLPATVPMSEFLNSRLFLLLATGFAVVSISTAYLSNVMALIGFMDDLSYQQVGKTNPLASRLLAFRPPIVIAIVYPIKGYGHSGGFGIVSLFGILPSLIAYKKANTSRQKILAVIMFIIFAVFFILECAQEFGLLHIDPDKEYWNVMMKKG
ncbi:MAG: hypothetical protein N2738_09995 [Thermodesulfovibrionales bacterium]|nr:hypothetical protein [Thermodesulfovibrionales bacterium]